MQMSLSGLAALIREEGHFNGKSALVTKIRHCQWLQVQIRTLGPRSWNRGHFHGLFLANLGSRTSFPAGSFEISPACFPAPSTDSPTHSRFLQGSPGIGGGERERGGRKECVCMESGLWGRRRRPPFIALLRQYPPQQKSRHGSTDRPTYRRKPQSLSSLFSHCSPRNVGAVEGKVLRPHSCSACCKPPCSNLMKLVHLKVKDT